MTWDYYNTGEDEIEKIEYQTQGTMLEMYALMAGLAALGVTLMFTDEDFIAGRKAFVAKLKRMYENAKAKVKRKGD